MKVCGRLRGPGRRRTPPGLGWQTCWGGWWWTGGAALRGTRVRVQLLEHTAGGTWPSSSSCPSECVGVGWHPGKALPAGVWVWGGPRRLLIRQHGPALGQSPQQLSLTAGWSRALLGHCSALLATAEAGAIRLLVSSRWEPLVYWRASQSCCEKGEDTSSLSPGSRSSLAS